MRLRHLSITVIAFSLAACGSADDVAEAPRETAQQSTPAPDIVVEGPERRILAFGDSLFAGYGVGRENSYPAKLETALRKAGVNAVVVNAAISGETTGAGAQRLKFTLDAQEVKPDLVILELGGNDMLRAIPPAATRTNFEFMLGELKERNIPVLLMGMRAPPNYGAQYQEEFDGIYTAMADQFDAEIIPFWLESIYQDQSLFQDDRIHPTVKGIDALVLDTLDEVRAAIPPKG